MTTATLPLTSDRHPLALYGDYLFRISVAAYHEMIANGILGPEDDVELLEGVLVKKMPKNEPHIFATGTLGDLLYEILPVGWHVNSQDPVTTDDSEPEPDLAIVRGNRRDFLGRKRHAADTPLIIEVADSSLARDREKRRIYARAGFIEYWIVNLQEAKIEVYTQPGGPGEDSDYRQSREYMSADSISVLLDGQEVGQIAVKDVLP